MKPDAKIRKDVIRQLQWDVQVPNPDAIGVAVEDGAVTLAGHVMTYAQKLAATHAAERVQGVKAVVDELTLHLPGERDDEDIARAIAHVLTSNVYIPGVRPTLTSRTAGSRSKVTSATPSSGLKLSG